VKQKLPKKKKRLQRQKKKRLHNKKNSGDTRPLGGGEETTDPSNSSNNKKTWPEKKHSVEGAHTKKGGRWRGGTCRTFGKPRKKNTAGGKARGAIAGKSLFSDKTKKKTARQSGGKGKRRKKGAQSCYIRKN